MILDVWIGNKKQGSVNVSKQKAKGLAIKLHNETKKAVELSNRLGEVVVFVNVNGQVYTLDR